MARGSLFQLLPVALICTWLTAICSGQGIDPDEVRTHSGPYLPSGAFGFRADAKLVEIPTVVRDFHGRAVDGLHQQNFEVYDAGRTREIKAFSVHNGRPPDPAPVSPSPAAYGAGESAGRSAAKMETKSDPRYVALVFDDENAGFDNVSIDGLIRAVDAGVRFVQEGLSKGDRAAVFSLSQGPISSFTTDTSKLIEAMKSLRLHRRLQPPNKLTGCLLPYTAYRAATRIGGSAPPAPAQARTGTGAGRPSAPRGSAANMQATLARSLWDEVKSNSLRLLQMLGDVVDLMGKLPGTRMVLVASPGFQTGTLEIETQDVIDRAVRSGVVVNSMDVTGLWGGPTGADCSPGWAIGREMQQAADDVLLNLTSGTGGQFFHNNNGLLRGFRDLNATPEVSYLLGFAPDNTQDGRYHKVQVRVNPASHYNVQARPGYFAPDANKGKPGQVRKLDQAVLASDTRNDIPVRLTMVTDQVTRAPAVWAVAHVDVAKLEFRRVDDRRVQDLTIVAALFDGQGNFVLGKEGGISFSLKAGSFTSLSKEGVNCTLTLLAPPGTYRLRTVVTDAASGRMVTSNESVELR
jgi:VWFA-related protein